MKIKNFNLTSFDCNDGAELIMRLVDNINLKNPKKELTPRERVALYKHIIVCEDCRELYAHMISATEIEANVELPEDFSLNVMSSIKKQNLEEKPAPPQINWFAIFACGYAFILSAFLGIAYLENPESNLFLSILVDISVIISDITQRIANIDFSRFEFAFLVVGIIIGGILAYSIRIENLKNAEEKNFEITKKS